MQYKISFPFRIAVHVSKMGWCKVQIGVDRFETGWQRIKGIFMVLWYCTIKNRIRKKDFIIHHFSKTLYWKIRPWDLGKETIDEIFAHSSFPFQGQWLTHDFQSICNFNSGHYPNQNEWPLPCLQSVLLFTFIKHWDVVLYQVGDCVMVNVWNLEPIPWR